MNSNNKISFRIPDFIDPTDGTAYTDIEVIICSEDDDLRSAVTLADKITSFAVPQVRKDDHENQTE